MIRLSLQRPVSTVIASAALAAVGLFSLFRLPVSLLPSLERPRVLVAIDVEGRSAGDMLRDVTEPLERLLASTPGVRTIVSETEDGVALLTLETAWGTDVDDLRIDLGRRLEGRAGSAGDVVRVEVAGDLAPTIEVAVRGGESASARSLFAERILVPELARIPGAGRVEIVGISKRRAVVRPTPAPLPARGITTRALAERLGGVGQAFGAGSVRDGAVVRPILVRESVTSLDQLRQLRVPHAGGAALLGDLATVTVEDVHDETLYRLDGEPAVLVRLFRAPNENAVRLARDSRAAIERLAARSAANELVVVRDGSGEIVAALRGLGMSALIGLLLGTLVLRWMLGSWRPTIGLAVVIPVSLLLSFAAFLVAGIPLDVISLSGLALAAGMIVDNSIVVLEAIETLRARGDRDPELHGARRVATAVAASTVTTVIVFAPLLYLRGIARAFFGEQAFAIAACITASLLFSLTLTPVLARRAAPAGDVRSPGLAAYQSALARAFARPGLVMMLSGALLVLAFGSGALLPIELFPASSPAEVRVDFELSRDLTPDEAFARGEALQEELRQLVPAQELVTMQLIQGLSREGRPGRPESWRGRIDARMRGPRAAARAFERMREHLGGSAGVRAVVSFGRSAFVEGLAARRDRLEVAVLAESAPRAGALSGILVDAVASSGGEARLDETSRPRRTTILEWKEDVIARAGLDRVSLETDVRSALAPADLGAIELPETEELVRLEPPRDEMIESLPVVIAIDAPAVDGAATSRAVPLGALATLRDGERPAAIVRIDGRPAVRVSVDRARTGFDALRGVIERIPIGPLQEIRLSGEAAEIEESFGQLRLVLALSILLVFLSIAAFYESFLSPLLIMVSVPVAAAGGIVLLFATGQSLNVMSLIGLVLLAGIVVNQTIILIDRGEQARRDGASAEEAMRIAANERYRPILMTTLTTLLGMVPLVILGGEGIELRRALATTVIGGLTSATIATLLLVPILYLQLEPIRVWWSRRRGAESSE